LNFIISFVQQTRGEEMFFNHLVDGVVRKLFGVKGQSLRWENSQWLDEGDVV
jgi:hypothetical protein